MPFAFSPSTRARASTFRSCFCPRSARKLAASPSAPSPSSWGRVMSRAGSASGTPTTKGLPTIPRAARREGAERVRLAYVAATRASEAMFFVGDRRLPGGGATDAFRRTTAGALLELAEDLESRERAQLDVEAVDVPSQIERATPPVAAPGSLAAPVLPGPSWRSLPIATTALQDFHHCPRRFQL